MRPLPGTDALPSATKPRSRKSSIEHAAHPSSHVPTAFFMKREEDLEHPIATSTSTDPAGRLRESTFGVQSLADTLEAAFGPHGSGSEGIGSNKDSVNTTSRSLSHGSSSGSTRPLEGSRSSQVRKSKRHPANNASSSSFALPRVDAPSTIPNSAVPSTPTSASLHSLKLSDEESTLDEVASQAIISSGDEEEDVDMQQEPSDSLLQLVMPRIQMPTRRPFTTKGKAMGKLKIMVAGQRGIGKTSLIRSILQVCEHIIHVDPISSTQLSSQPNSPKSNPHNKRGGNAGTTQVTEIHASTKPYPHWWTDVEENRTVRRRKGSVDTVLDRNICFVDTPGFSTHSSEREDIDLVVNYLESVFYQTSSVNTLDDSDIISVVSGNGGVSVDVVLYLLSPNQDISRDIEFMQHLSKFTNVVPVIGKSDTLSSQDIITLKTSILARLQTTPVKPFFFGKALDDALLAVQSLSIVHKKPTPGEIQEASSQGSHYLFTTPTYPYAISSIPGPDSENMDASLLMSPDYIQPLLASELTALVNQVFDPDSIAWLRHSAARKFLAWRRRTKLPSDSLLAHGLRQNRIPTTTTSIGLTGPAMNSKSMTSSIHSQLTSMPASANSSIFSTPSPSGVLVPRSGSSLIASNLHSPFLESSFSLANSENLDNPGDFSLTRYDNLAQGEQRLAEVRISKWATDLQRSLRNERDRFEELQRSDRAKWLLERVGEEVSRGNIVTSPCGPPRAEWAIVRHGDDKADKARKRFKEAAGVDSRDPLGLCDFSDEVRRRGFVFVKFLGGMSVLGAVVVGVVRACGMETGLPQNGWWSCIRGWLTGSAE